MDKLSLQNFIEKNGMDWCKALNILQNNGVISDNVIFCSDVAAANVPAAIEFLSRYLVQNSPCQAARSLL